MKTILLKQIFIFFIGVIGFSSCKVNWYRQNVMFQTEVESIMDTLKKNDDNYLLKERDYFELKVYTNNGELIIDPNFQLRRDLGGNMMNQGQQKAFLYLIREDGQVLLPMVGDVKLVGLTIYQATQLLKEKYATFYEMPFVHLIVDNRRVIVLGGTKGGTVIPLENEKMTLLEVLAISGGVDNMSKAHNIRLIRGDLKNPEVQIIDLSTIEGMKKANLEMQPNDIVYIEPIRRVITESLRDFGPIMSFLTTIISVGVLIISLSNNKN